MNLIQFLDSIDGLGLTITEDNETLAENLAEFGYDSDSQVKLYLVGEDSDQEPETCIGEVKLVASGYDFTCPECEEPTHLIESAPYVRCARCFEWFEVDQVLHAGKHDNF